MQLKLFYEKNDFKSCCCGFNDISHFSMQFDQKPIWIFR